MSDHILYELECGEVTFGELDDVNRIKSRCLIHGKLEQIARVITSEWVVFCDDCIRWRRWCGMDRDLAHTLSRRHWRANPAHNPQIAKRGRWLSIMAEKDLKKRVVEMEGMWYNGRVMLPGKAQELPDEPPY